MKDEYEDRDNWIGYDYKKFVMDLEHGREIEFSYKKSQYSITHWQEGWIFGVDSPPEKKERSDYYKDVHDLLKIIKIEGKTLEQLFEENELTKDNIIHVY
jgi:hypothetical protein